MFSQGLPEGLLIGGRNDASNSINEIRIENIPDGLKTEDIYPNGGGSAYGNEIRKRVTI
jgi:hypothetical protein